MWEGYFNSMLFSLKNDGRLHYIQPWYARLYVTLRNFDMKIDIAYKMWTYQS